MFSPLTPAEVVAAIGATAREAARATDPSGEFARGQLLSAASASRHLTVELAGYGPLLEAFVAEVVLPLEDVAALTAWERADLVDRLGEARDARVAGEVVCDLLDALRADASPAATVFAGEVHAALRRLADAEVALLAAELEGAA